MACAKEAVACWFVLATEDRGLYKNHKGAIQGMLISAFTSEKILIDWRRMSAVARHLLACSNSSFYLPPCYGGVDCICRRQFFTAEGCACAPMQLSRSQFMNVVWGALPGVGQSANPKTHLRIPRASCKSFLSIG